jgi:hypothetical protein
MVVMVNLYCYVLPEQGYPAVADRHCPALGEGGHFFGADRCQTARVHRFLRVQNEKLFL